MKLELDNIKKEYDRVVLDHVSYTFETGKLYVIKGVSGCGKTTLFHIIGGLENRYEGKLLWNDVEVSKQKKYREHIGYIFQQSLLLSNITVWENLQLIKNDNEKIYQLSKEVGVENLLEKFPDELSGGERQRVTIVRALLLEPDILLADEPTASLDKTNSNIVAQLLARYKDKIVLVATHESYFDELADEIIHLNYEKIESVNKYES